MIRRTILILFAVAAVAAAGAWYLHSNNRSSTLFRTATVEVGDLLATISSTATIEPEEVVDVGAQVAGMIKSFGRDPRDADRAIDYGSPVEEGTVLAQIDDAIYKAQVSQAKANLDRADSDSLQAKTKLNLARRDWTRVSSLRERNAISDAEFDKTQSDYEAAQSAVASADAAVSQGKANLDLAEINLKYTTIQSPVKGVIIDRRVNVGQTVLASLNAPSLFLIAKDLKRLQLWASVNEADIGQIHPAQVVRFTVDAYPGEVFVGTVAQIRLNATMTQNVVTYTVVVETDNSSGKLLPYLTANVQFEIAHHTGMLLVPNAALRWRPQPAQVAPQARESFVQAARRRANDRFGSSKSGKTPREQTAVWVQDGDFVRPVEVQLGLSDGSMTEINSGDVHEGMQVVVGEARRESTDSTTNPFTPKMFGGGRPQQ
jgi:HlyD family secretion protein